MKTSTCLYGYFLQYFQKTLRIKKLRIITHKLIFFLFLYNRKFQKESAMDLQWRTIQVDQVQPNPKARWGHSGCELDDPTIFLFGGYSQSKYYNDSWIFNWSTMSWKEIVTSITPSARSNCSVIYDKKNKKIYLFGGGSSSNTRHNDLWSLNINKPDKWNLISKPGSDSNTLSFSFPWPRTYHTCCLYKNNLIIYGGEGFGNDLQDIWAFNLSTHTWKQFKCNKIPHGRRFHSSALIDNFYYIIGGCHDGYSCLNDIHRIDLDQCLNCALAPLQQQIPPVNWEQIKFTENNVLSPRWGHRSCAIDGNIYIFGGRSSVDHNDLIIISGKKSNNGHGQNPENNPNHKHYIQAKNMKINKIKTLLPPKGRRRPCLWSIGNCILIHGGFSGSYYEDLTFININTNSQLNFEPIKLHKISQPEKTFQNCLKQMKKKYKSNIIPRFSIDLKLSQEHAQFQIRKANQFEQFWKSFDLHISTKDKKVIHLRKNQIRNAFSSEDLMINFMERLAEEPYEIACKYTRAIQSGIIPLEFSNQQRQYLFRNGAIIKDSLLGTMQRRMLTNVLKQQVLISGSNPLKAIKVRKNEVQRIYTQIINNPSNNLQLQIILKNKKTIISVNKYMIAQRSQYFAQLISNSLKYSDRKIELMTNIFNKKLINEAQIEAQFQKNLSIYKILIIYLHHGHMVLPNNLSFEDLLQCYALAEMYLIQGARQIILSEILEMIVFQNELNVQKNAQETILKEISNKVSKLIQQNSLRSIRGDNILQNFINFCLEGDDIRNLNRLIQIVIGKILLDASKSNNMHKKQVKTPQSNGVFGLNTISKYLLRQWGNDKQNKQNKSSYRSNNKQNCTYSKDLSQIFNKEFASTLTQIKKVLSSMAHTKKDKEKIRSIASNLENAYKLQLSFWQKIANDSK